MARQKRSEEQEKPQAQPPHPMLFGQTLSELDDEEIEEMAQEDEFDIFVDVGDKLTKAGDRITYTIKRDGDFIAGAIRHPFSWDKIKKDYGSGTFQVIARSTNKGGYVKSQTRNVAATTDDDFGGEKDEAKNGNSTTDLLMLLQAQKREEREEMLRLDERRERERLEREEKIERERKERDAQMKSSQDSTMLMMMKMMESQSSQTTALLTAMLSNKKEPEINVEKIMSMMDARMEKVISMVNGKDKTKDIDALKLIELQSQAEDRGYKRAMDLQAQAERKAEELAELRENNGANGEQPSTTKALIEAVAPVVQTFMAAKGAGLPSIPAAMVPQALPAPQNPRVNPHAPAVSRPQTEIKVRERKPMTKKEAVEKLVIMEIGKDLGANFLTPSKLNPEQTAQKCLSELNKFGISADELCNAYTVDAMMEIARANKMPEAIKPYIERFYAAIVSQKAKESNANSATQASVDAGGNSKRSEHDSRKP